jgi:transposase
VSQAISYVGLDVHQEEIAVAVLVGTAKDVVEFRQGAAAVGRLIKKLLVAADGGPILAVYEAGPCGYELSRRLKAAGIDCRVVAPSLIPVEPGQRIKTDRRDAKKLARLLRAGMLTDVAEPTPAEEAVRDLCRSREDARQDLMRARHRLGKMLLRRGRVYRAGRAWTQRHRTWLKAQRFDHPADEVVFTDYLTTVEWAEERVRRLDAELMALAAQAPYAEPVGWLRCLRGFDTVTALSVVAELFDVRRFATARQLMAYLGLVPSERSSGSSVRRGGITKTGNAHVRRLLVEAAWHARHRPAVSQALRQRRRAQPPEIIALSDRAMQRLWRRWWHLVHHGKSTPKATTAVARELAGFVWAILQLGAAQPDAG